MALLGRSTAVVQVTALAER